MKNGSDQQNITGIEEMDLSASLKVPGSPENMHRKEKSWINHGQKNKIARNFRFATARLGPSYLGYPPGLHQ